MAFSYFLRVLPTAILAFNVVVVVGARRRRQVRQLSALGLNLLDHASLLDSVLELLVLNLPLRVLFGTFGFGFLWWSFWWFWNMMFNPLTLTNLLVLLNTVRGKSPSTLVAVLQDLIGSALLHLRRFQIVALLWNSDRFLGRFVSLLHLRRFLQHGAYLTGFLVGFQRGWVELSAAILALHECWNNDPSYLLPCMCRRHHCSCWRYPS